MKRKITDSLTSIQSTERSDSVRSGQICRQIVKSTDGTVTVSEVETYDSKSVTEKVMSIIKLKKTMSSRTNLLKMSTNRENISKSMVQNTYVKRMDHAKRNGHVCTANTFDLEKYLRYGVVSLYMLDWEKIKDSKCRIDRHDLSVLVVYKIIYDIIHTMNGENGVDYVKIFEVDEGNHSAVCIVTLADKTVFVKLHGVDAAFLMAINDNCKNAVTRKLDNIVSEIVSHESSVKRGIVNKDEFFSEM